MIIFDRVTIISFFVGFAIGLVLAFGALAIGNCKINIVSHETIEATPLTEQDKQIGVIK